MDLVADVFKEILPPKIRVRLMSKKSSFRGPLDKEYGKWAETL